MCQRRMILHICDPTRKNSCFVCRPKRLTLKRQPSDLTPSLTPSLRPFHIARRVMVGPLCGSTGGALFQGLKATLELELQFRDWISRAWNISTTLQQGVFERQTPPAPKKRDSAYTVPQLEAQLEIQANTTAHATPLALALAALAAWQVATG